MTPQRNKRQEQAEAKAQEQQARQVIHNTATKASRLIRNDKVMQQARQVIHNTATVRAFG